MIFAKDNAADASFNRWTINGVAFPNNGMASEVLPAAFRLKQGQRYRLRMRNASDDIHPIHLHRHSFELANVAGTKTAGITKDVVMLGGYQQYEVDLVADLTERSMELAQGDSARKLLLWGAPIVVGHFLAVTWHLMILTRIRPNVPGFLPAVLLLVDPLPIAGPATCEGVPEARLRFIYGAFRYSVSHRSLRSLSELRHRQRTEFPARPFDIFLPG